MLLAIGLVATACAGAAPFDPTGPCTTDGSLAGAYPELEARIPSTFRGQPPTTLDSGRSCTANGLGTLAAHGVTELRFAGGTWETGTSSGVSLVVFRADDLDPAWVAEFYGAGAQAARNVESLESNPYPISDEIQGTRIDALNRESYQSVVIWPEGDVVAIALIGNFIREIQTKDAHDIIVRDAVDTLRG